MKLYKFLQTMDLRHSDEWNDYENIEIMYVVGDEVETVPNTLRSILRFADCPIDSVGMNFRDGRPMLDIIITNKKNSDELLDILQHQRHLCE